MKLQLSSLFTILFCCNIFNIICSADQHDEKVYRSIPSKGTGRRSGDDIEYLRSTNGKPFDDQLTPRDLQIYLSLNDGERDNTHSGKQNFDKTDIKFGESISPEKAPNEPLNNLSKNRRKGEISEQKTIIDNDAAPFVVEDRPVLATDNKLNQEPYKKVYDDNIFKRFRGLTQSRRMKENYYDKSMNILSKTGSPIAGNIYRNSLSPDFLDQLRSKTDSKITEINRKNSISADESFRKNSRLKNGKYVLIPKFRRTSFRKGYDTLLANLYNEKVTPDDKSSNKIISDNDSRLQLDRQIPERIIYLGESYRTNSDEILKGNLKPGTADLDRERGHNRKAYRGRYKVPNYKKVFPIRRKFSEEIYTVDPVNQQGKDGRAFRGGYIKKHHRNVFPIRREISKEVYTMNPANLYEEQLIPMREGMYTSRRIYEEKSPVVKEQLIPMREGMYTSRRIYEEKSPVVMSENHLINFPYDDDSVGVVKVVRKNYSPLINKTPLKFNRQYLSPSNLGYTFSGGDSVEIIKPEHLYPSVHDTLSDINFMPNHFTKQEPVADSNDARLLALLKYDFYKAYKNFVETLEIYYSESSIKNNFEAVEKQYNKLQLKFKNYQASIKGIFPDGNVPESVKKSMEAAEKVKEFFDADNQNEILNKYEEYQSSRRVIDQPVKDKIISSSMYDYNLVKNNYVAALNSYYTTLKLFRDNPTDEHFDRAVETYKVVLNCYRKYRYEYNRFMNPLPDDSLQGRNLNSNAELENRSLELPKDPLTILNKPNKYNSTSLTNSYHQQKLKYGKLEKSYLSMLVMYYKLLKNKSPDDLYQKDLENAYINLKKEHDKYLRLFISLFARNSLPEEEKMFTFPLLPDTTKLIYLSRAPVDNPNKTKEYDERLRQHDAARLSYLEQQLEYSMAVNDYYSTNSTGSYLNAVNAYKKLIDLRRIYYYIYLHVFQNQITDSPKYQFPKVPKLFIHKPYYGGKSGVRINIEDITDKDLDKMEYNFEVSTKEYEQLSREFILNPSDEILYHKVLASYDELLRRHSVCEYLYRYLISNSSSYSHEHHEPASLKLNLEIKISDLHPPKSVIVPRKRININDMANSLFQEKRSGVLKEIIQQMRQDYEITLTWYYAMADLLQDKGLIRDDKNLSISDGIRSDYSVLKMYHDLCKIIKDRLGEKVGVIGWGCFLDPLPEVF